MLAHAILGLLADTPMHGYALKKALAPALGRGGLPNDGVVYPLLARLQREKKLKKQIQRSPGKPDRHVWSVTPAGRAAFEQWLERGDDERDEVTYDFFVGHPFVTKCMFFDQLSPGAIRDKLAAQQRATRDKVSTFEQIRAAMIERRVSGYRTAILELGIARQRATLRWLRQLEQRLTKEEQRA